MNYTFFQRLSRILAACSRNAANRSGFPAMSVRCPCRTLASNSIPKSRLSFSAIASRTKYAIPFVECASIASRIVCGTYKVIDEAFCLFIACVLSILTNRGNTKTKKLLTVLR